MKHSLPIGIFPGGNENRSLKMLRPNIYASTERYANIRAYCESAMALITDQRQNVHIYKVEMVYGSF